MTQETAEAAPAADIAQPGAGWREGPIGRRNVVWGWCAIVLGPSVGSILMAWCFGANNTAGPFPAPFPWLEDYGSVERRMLRLAHVAMVMIPLINIVLGHELDQVALSGRWKRRASWLAALAIPGVPLGLTLAGVSGVVDLKYLSVPGVYAFIAALAIVAVGKVRQHRAPAPRP